MDEYVAALPRAARLGVLAAAAAVDQGARLYPPARGRRFARLGDAVASRYLGLLLDSRVARVRSTASPLRALAALCHYDVPEVRARIGYEPEPHIARVARRRMERFGDEIRRVEEPPATALEGEPAEPECDVVVVGSGAGGATVVAELADAGAHVVVVEEGGHHATESFTTDVVHAYRTLYRSGGAQTIVGTPPITFLEGRCVGGLTVVNGGMCWRTPDRVLERWSREDRIEAIGPEQMARHFEAVERRLSISPQDSESIGRDAQLLREGAEALGWELDRSRRNQLHCGGCDNFLCGCPTGAKRSMLVTNVPRALRRGALLVPDCRVDRIVLSGRARHRSPRALHGVRPDALGASLRRRGRLRCDPDACAVGAVEAALLIPGSSAGTSPSIRAPRSSRSSTRRCGAGRAFTRRTR